MAGFFACAEGRFGTLSRFTSGDAVGAGFSVTARGSLISCFTVESADARRGFTPLRFPRLPLAAMAISRP
jgi:hypothetical protein